jgi:aerobic carbon-monoxide dehydrogenase medium subunit
MLVALRGRRHIAPFALHRPETIAETLALCAAAGSSAFLAGGIDLIDRLKHGDTIDRLIRLDGVPGLAGISVHDGLLRIGAMATHAAITESDTIRGVLPDLTALWDTIANPRVRFTGTIGGNVMSHPDYDALPALMALGAEAEIATDAGPERVDLETIAARRQPLLTGFTVENPGAKRLFADRTLRPALTVWLGLEVIDGRVKMLRLAVGIAHPTPVRAALPLDIPLELLSENAARIAADATQLLPEPMSDSRAGAAYRKRMTVTLTRRILTRAGEHA